LKDTLVSIVVLGGILLLSAIITQWFARTMYRRCTACGTLNARRRAQCRNCAQPLT
jgi:type IV secretory pathway VirB6-like protein